MLGLAVLLAVCLAPSAKASDPAPDKAPPRDALAARQVLQDTAVQTGRHPLRAGATLLADLSGLLRSAEVGLVRKRLAMNLAGSAGPLPSCRPTLDPGALDAELKRVTGAELQPASIRLYPDGAEALDALDGLIDGAACRIDVLMYLWDDDPIGRDVATRLASRAGPDLPVRVLVDGGGNLLQGEPKEASAAEVNRVVCWLSRQPYVQLLRTRDPGLHFDHRKLVVADGRTAWSGGRNFTRRAFLEDHDLSYTVVGPLAAEAAAVFENFWREQGGRAAGPLPSSPTPPYTANARARLVGTGPRDRQLERSLYGAVDAARDHIFVENPYFADNLLESKLAQARRRGVDVRAMLTLHDVSATIDRANRVTADRLLRAGVRVYLYPGMTHVKAAAVDGRWAYIGTGNFDTLSLRRNRELGLAIGSGALIGEVEERIFARDFCPEWELTEPLPLRPCDYLSETIANLFL